MRKRLTVDNRWLFLLPISRQRLFAMITLPPLAAITVCCLIQLHFSPLPAAVIVLDGVAVAGVCLLVFSIIGLFSFFPQGGSWRRLSQTLALILPVGWVIYQFFTPPKGQFWKRGLSPFEMWVASLAPNHLPLLMVSAAAALIILYGLACAGFCRMDIPPKRTTATR